MIDMKVCKLHMCTSTYAYNYTRSSSSYNIGDVLYYIELEFIVYCCIS